MPSNPVNAEVTRLVARAAGPGRWALVDDGGRARHEVEAPTSYAVADGQAVLAYLDPVGALNGWMPEGGDAGMNLRVGGAQDGQRRVAECFGWCGLLWEVTLPSGSPGTSEHCLECGGDLELPRAA